MKKTLILGMTLNVLLLSIVSLLNDLSSEMILPILPLFLGSLGASGVALGIIGGLRDSVASILNVFSGYWSDRIGRRKIFVVWGYLSSAVFKLFISTATVWQQVLVFAGLERMGKGLRTAPRDAIIADSMGFARGRAFGIHRAFDTTGAILGSITGFILLWYFDFSFPAIIFAAAVLSFFSLIPLYFVRDVRRKPQHVSLKIGFSRLPRRLKLFILVASIFTLANFSYFFFVLHAQGLFTGKLALGAPILLYILFNIVYTVFAIPFGILSDRIGRAKVLVAGYFLFALTCLGFALFYSITAYVVLFAFYGLVFAMIEGTQRALVSDLAPRNLRATALGTYHTTIGIIALPASIIAGVFWQIAPAYTFLYGTIVSLGAVLAFLAFSLRLRKQAF